MNFHGRQVVVTGGTGALGTAIVGALIEEGATCHVPYISDREVERFDHHDHAQVKLTPACNLTDEAAVAALYDPIPNLWASIHLVGGFAMDAIENIDKAALMKQVEMNFVTAFLCTRAAITAIGKTGAGGRIVNVAARPALEWRSGAGMTAYAAAKAAVAAFTKAVADEVVKTDILVNAVAPSIMDTAANRASMPNADYSNWPKVSEVAATILFLASPDNQVARGAIVPVYGKF